MSVSASRTSSSLNGLIVAMMNFTLAPFPCRSIFFACAEKEHDEGDWKITGGAHGSVRPEIAQILHKFLQLITFYANKKPGQPFAAGAHRHGKPLN
jgi:hypothetical protein